MKKGVRLVGAALVAALCLSFVGCVQGMGESVQEQPSPTATAAAAQDVRPAIPDKLDLQNGVPLLTVYVVNSKSYRGMDIESYVEGVLAGEMRNDWPMEALKAQAILARTFVLKFVSEKQSQYPDADISTDIQEAQAFAEENVNERVRKAVEETRGMVLSDGGSLPYAWFHAHSGGKTELAVPGLEYEGAEPDYTQVVDSKDSDKAPTTVKNWTARFTTREVAEAAAKTGVETGTVETLEVGEKAESGRAVTLKLNGKSVSAPALRLALDSTRWKSTLITEIAVQDGEVIVRGSGYGHGVGMSQWGAYALAEEGKSAEEIIQYYFRNLEIARLWD